MRRNTQYKVLIYLNMVLRVLMHKNYLHSILTSELFLSSQDLFEDHCCELKNEYLGRYTPYSKIAPSGNTLLHYWRIFIQILVEKII